MTFGAIYNNSRCWCS